MYHAQPKLKTISASFKRPYRQCNVYHDNLSSGYTFAKINSVRLYKCSPNFTVEKLEAHMTAELKDCNYYDDPVFELVDSTYLDPESFDTIEDCMIEQD